MAPANSCSVQDYKNVQRWTDVIAERPAVKRGRMVNRTCGEPASQLHERHDASDFDTRTQDKIDGQAAAATMVDGRRRLRIHHARHAQKSAEAHAAAAHRPPSSA